MSVDAGHELCCRLRSGSKAPKMMVDINHLERVQRLVTRLVRGLHHVTYEERFCQLSLFSTEHRHLRADLILAFKVWIDLNTPNFFPPWPPTEYCKGRVVSHEEVLCPLCVLWHSGTDCQLPLSYHPRCMCLISSWIFNKVASFLKSQLDYCSPTLSRLTVSSSYCPLLTTVVCIYGSCWPPWLMLPLEKLTWYFLSSP